MMNDIPQAAAVANLPRNDRRSAEQRAKFFRQQFEGGLELRRPRAHQWMRVAAIMKGVHYFSVQYGVLRPLGRKPGQIRAVFPIMKPLYLWGLGSLNSNELGITATPTTGQGRDSFYRAKRAQHIMSAWLEETGLQAGFDEANQHLLYYGMQAYLRYVDAFRGNVFVTSLSGDQIFPIPFDATSPDKCDGFMRVSLMSKQWLEMQDDLYERQHGKPPPKRMASMAGSGTVALSHNYLGFSSGHQIGSRLNGATCAWIWMKPSPYSPHGETGFMVEDEIFRYKTQPDESGPPLFGGKVPLELVYHTKMPDDFWGHGFLEELISPQLEANRQWTSILKSAYLNRGLVAYDSDRIDAKMIHNCEDGFVPMGRASYEMGAGGRAIEHVPPVPMNLETGSVLGLVRQAAREAVGMESEILFGVQSKRTESGLATGLLNNNASVPKVPVINRIGLALRNTYPEVLDMLALVWPDAKLVQAVGDQNLAKEMLIRRDELPASREVRLTPTPLLANGKNALLQMLFQLRQMPSDDGQGSEVKSREMRRSLIMLGMQIPGLDLVSAAEQRIMWRIGQLIGDGMQPAIPPADQQRTPEQMYENHPLAMELLVEHILDPSFSQYGPLVKQALLMEYKFHLEAAAPTVHPDNMDDQQALHDAQQTENYLDFAEQDVNSAEGIMAIDGLPVGLDL